MQPDLADGIVYALGKQQLVEPGQSAALCRGAPVTVVCIMKRNQGAAVDGQSAAALARHAAHGQQQKPGAVGERMQTRALARVADFAGAYQRLVVDGRVHAGSSAISSCKIP